MHEQDMHEKCGKGKAPMPWFKMYPKAWRDDTRHLTPEQRGIYFDCLCLLYQRDEPLPLNDGWMAYELHVNVKVWRRVRDVLVADKKLLQTPDGYVNNRASIELEERQKRRSSKVSTAVERELQRRCAPELPFGNKGRCSEVTQNLRVVSTTEVSSRARASDHQIIEEEKKERGSSSAPPIDDDPHRRRCELSPAIIAKLKAAAGEEEAERLMRVYFRSTHARDARFIDGAFSGWLASQDVKLSGTVTPKALADEIIALCGKDASGRVDTSLPKVVSKTVSGLNRIAAPTRKREDAA